MSGKFTFHGHWINEGTSQLWSISRLSLCHPGPPCHKGKHTCQTRTPFPPRGAGKTECSLIRKKKKMEVSNSYFPFTCLKYDNRVSECPSRDTRMRSWWAENTMPASFPLWGDKKQNDLQVAASVVERNAMILEKSSTFFFFNWKKKKKEWEENANSCG